MMGKFYSFAINEENQSVIVIEKENKLVNSGRRFIIDRIFDTGTNNWDDSRVADIAIGISTDTNAGVTGPTNTAPVSTSGSWKGPSVNDWKLSDEILRKACSVRRTGEVAYASATFLDEEFTPYFSQFGTGSILITEEGLFLSGTEPTADPIEDTSQQTNAMLCRSTLASNNGSGYYVTEPIAKADDGNQIGIAYEFNWEGL